MSVVEKRLADQALMQVQALELTLHQMEYRNPWQTTNLAAMGHQLLEQLRSLVGDPRYCEVRPDPNEQRRADS